MTLKEHLEKWCETHRQGLSPTTDQRYRRLLRVHIIPHSGETGLQKLSVIQIEEMINHLLREDHKGYGPKRRLSPKTVRDVISLLRQALKRAMEWNLITPNPTTRVNLPKPAPKEPKIATEDQAAALLTHCGIPVPICRRLSPIIGDAAG